MYPSPPLSREIESALLLRIDTMAARFSPQTPLRELLDETLDVVIVATGTRFGYVHLLNPTTGELHLMTQRGFGPELLNFFSVVHRDHCSCAEATRVLRPVVVANVETDPSFDERTRQIMLRAHVLALQSTPLLTPEASLVGVVSSHYTEPTTPSARALDLV